MIFTNSCVTIIKDHSLVSLAAEIEKLMIRGEKLVGPVQAVTVNDGEGQVLYIATLVQGQ